MKSIYQLKRFAYIALFTIYGFAITSCKKDNLEAKLPYDLTRGVAISNEGSWGSSSASLSLYLPDKDSVVNDIFTSVNGRPLGDVFQSIGFAGNNAYLVVNSSNKIEVIDVKTCAQQATISNLSQPRYFASINNQKAYVSLWGDNGNVGVIDLTTNTLGKVIQVGRGPEKLAILGHKAFIANSGGLGTDNTLSIIDTQTDEVATTITVGDNPKDFAIDKNGKVWVLCSGNIEYGADYSITSQTSAKLIMINPETNDIEKTIDLGNDFHPSHLGINHAKDILYYGGDFGIAGIFAVSISATEKSTTPIINEFFYGFNVDPSSGTIYGLQTPTFTSAGFLKRYNPQGETLGVYKVGIIPNGAYFAN